MQIGKQCKPVQVHKFASSAKRYHFALLANLLVGAASPIPLEQHLRRWLLVHSERFVKYKNRSSTIVAELLFLICSSWDGGSVSWILPVWVLQILPLRGHR